MDLNGWQFKVISPIFAVHWGLKSKKSWNKWRNSQNRDNMKLFEGFKKEARVKAGLPVKEEKKQEVTVSPKTTVETTKVNATKA